MSPIHYLYIVCTLLLNLHIDSWRAKRAYNHAKSFLCSQIRVFRVRAAASAGLQ